MKIIVGLGNPGAKYKLTRHNVGFLALDFYLKDKQPITCQSKFQAEICELHNGDKKVFFVKPQTFMNLSGEAIRELCQFYKVDPTTDVLVIHDEADLPLGTTRATANSSPAGHNGIKSIFAELGTQEINRLRIGIESRAHRQEVPTDVFVLQNFTEDELKKLNDEIFPAINKTIDTFLN